METSAFAGRIERGESWVYFDMAGVGLEKIRRVFGSAEFRMGVGLAAVSKW
jgi:hypothetical protein